MLDEQTPAESGNESTETPSNSPTDGAAPPPRKRAPRKTAAKKTAVAEPAAVDAAETTGDGSPQDEAPAPRKRAPRKTAAKKPAAPEAVSEAAPEPAAPADAESGAGSEQPAKKTTARKRTAKKTTAATAPSETTTGETAPGGTAPSETAPGGTTSGESVDDTSAASAVPAVAPLFQPPDPAAAKPTKKAAKKAPAKKSAAKKTAASSDDADPTTATPSTEDAEDKTSADAEQDTTDDSQDGDENEGGARRRRRRGGRRRRKGPGESSDAADGGDTRDTRDAAGDDTAGSDDDQSGPAEKSDADGESGGEGGASTRRRRRRRRAGEGDDEGSEDSENTVTRVRKPRSAEDEITSFSGSTRLEAKKQRRREGREAGRRRAPIISEAEFLARRESVDRKMVIRQRDDLTQIAVLEDKVLVEHYVARESQTSLIGNVYLGRVQNVLPSMEAAFIDIGKGRNAVLYAGEVNWESFGAKDGNQRKIEQVLKPGQAILVQVSKDPIGHKGARLTSQVSLPGRFLVYVPDGNTSGISRKLPENERNRLKTLLKEIVPDTAGVIVRTAAEGASEDELTRDVERLKALWEDIESKVENGNAPELLYGEPDLTLKVVRDLFTEDIAKLVVSGAEAWEMVENYVHHVAPDLADRLERHDDSERDAFAEYRIDEQINKALDRKVWLPSGGSLVIDRTEAMTVVDVNTGKFTGSGGNLEETVTKNNLEAAEEMVRQLRLRDIGGIIVIDFIDMVLESNRDLVLRRLIECLGRDRTRHQVAEVTSLGLVQMTRKRIGTGLLEAFSENCEPCQGRGLIVHQEPVEQRRKQVDEEPRRNRRSRGRGKGDEQSSDSGPAAKPSEVRRPTPAEFAAMARAEHDHPESDSHAEPSEAAETAETPETPETAEAPETAETPVAPSVAPEPVDDTPPVAQPVTPPPPPAAPRIVTSVRRVGARRPAGPPSGQSSTAVLERSDDISAPGAGTSSAVPEESVDPTVPSVHDEDGAGSVGQPHVPVKKKGARKR